MYRRAEVLTLLMLAGSAVAQEPDRLGDLLREAVGTEALDRVAESLRGDAGAVERLIGILAGAPPTDDPFLEEIDLAHPFTMRGRAVRVLSTLLGVSPETVLPRDGRLGTGTAGWRGVATWVTASRGDPAALREAICRSVRTDLESNPALRPVALVALARLGDPAVRADLDALLGSADPAGRAAAIEGVSVLGERGDPFRRVLRDALAGEDPACAAAASRALGRLGDAGARRILREVAADHGDLLARAAADGARVRLGDERRVKALVPAAMDGPEPVRREAARGLASLSRADLLEAMEDVERGSVTPGRIGVWGVQWALGRDPDAGDRILEAIGSGDPVVRRCAVRWARATAVPGSADVLEASFSRDVDAAIESGVAFLLATSPTNPREVDGAETLELLTLVKCGVPAADPRLKPRIDMLASQAPGGFGGTYQAGLALMLFETCGEGAYPDALATYARYLIDIQKPTGVWGYGRTGSTSVDPAMENGDNSNTQFAVLGLRAAAHAGVQVPSEVWERTYRHFETTQAEYGAWSYPGVPTRSADAHTMTCAGVCCMVVCRAQILGEAGRTFDFLSIPHVRKGVGWLAEHFTVSEPQPAHSAFNWVYYYLYSLERVGALTGEERFEGVEWYRPGARYLLGGQGDDGSWRAMRSYGPVPDTCFALLFLRRATPPLYYDVGGWSPSGETAPPPGG